MSLHPKVILFFFSYCYLPWCMLNKLPLCIVDPSIPTNLSSPRKQMLLLAGHT